MQHENMQRLADFLRDLPDNQFDMSVYRAYRGCGTVGCIAGWGAILAGHTEPGYYNAKMESVPDIAAKWLGISVEERMVLFYHEAPWQTKEEAIAELERMIAEDKAEWALPVHDTVEV